MGRDQQRAAWEDWGRVDPFWAVLAEPGTSHGRWDVDRFFATGVETVAMLFTQAQPYGRPAQRGRALDVGCGLGRLTRALSPHFERTYGLDVSTTMIERARQLDSALGPAGAEFVLHDDEEPLPYASGSVDFLTCLLVLQHLPSREAIEGYLREFVRVLSPGGVAVVQLPARVPHAEPLNTGTSSRVRRSLALRARAIRLLRTIGVRPTFLYERLGWQPEMLMTAVPYDVTVEILHSAGGHLLFTPPEDTLPGGVVSHVYFVARGDVRAAE